MLVIKKCIVCIFKCFRDILKFIYGLFILKLNKTFLTEPGKHVIGLNGDLCSFVVKIPNS